MRSFSKQKKHSKIINSNDKCSIDTGEDVKDTDNEQDNDIVGVVDLDDSKTWEKVELNTQQIGVKQRSDGHSDEGNDVNTV